GKSTWPVRRVPASPTAADATTRALPRPFRATRRAPIAWPDAPSRTGWTMLGPAMNGQHTHRASGDEGPDGPEGPRGSGGTGRSGEGASRPAPKAKVKRKGPLRLLGRTMNKAWEGNIFSEAAEAAFWQTLSLPP